MSLISTTCGDFAENRWPGERWHADIPPAHPNRILPGSDPRLTRHGPVRGQTPGNFVRSLHVKPPETSSESPSRGSSSGIPAIAAAAGVHPGCRAHADARPRRQYRRLHPRARADAPVAARGAAERTVPAGRHDRLLRELRSPDQLLPLLVQAVRAPEGQRARVQRAGRLPGEYDVARRAADRRGGRARCRAPSSPATTSQCSA